MSAGPGWLQRSILDAVAGAPVPLPAEHLRWRIAEDAKGGPVESLGASFFRSFQRSVDRLVKAGKLIVDERKLGGFDEVVRFYPGKAHEGWLRDLRAELLPELASWISGQGPPPRYTSAQSEEFFVRGLQPSQLQPLQAAWRAIEDCLFELMSRQRGKDRRSLLSLVARCESLLGGARRLSVKESYGQLLQACIERRVLPADVQNGLERLGELIAPPEQFAHLRLKSLLHSLVDMADQGSWRLKDDTVQFLHRKRRDVLERLPGFLPASSPRRSARVVALGCAPQHSDRLYRLIDKSVCEGFTFLQAV